MGHQFIIGIGTGRCGTKSLTHILSMQRNTVAYHEYSTHRLGTPLPWHADNEIAELILKDLLMTNPEYMIADVAFYWLKYIPYLMEQTNARVISLMRPKREVVNSFIRRFPDAYFCQPNEPNNGYWKRTIHDIGFPSYEHEDPRLGYGRYYDEYTTIQRRFERMYSDRIFPTATIDLSDPFEVEDILKFCGYDEGTMQRWTAHIED